MEEGIMEEGNTAKAETRGEELFREMCELEKKMIETCSVCESMNVKLIGTVIAENPNNVPLQEGDGNSRGHIGDAIRMIRNCKHMAGFILENISAHV